MPPSASATPGTLHHIPPLTAFEPTPTTPSSTPPQNLLLWIGGLTDTYHSVAYPYTLSTRLPSTWSLAQAYLSSAAQGWGTSSLGRDVDELSTIVKYFRGQRKGKIVLMGHSTGCQDCMHYTSSVAPSGEREAIDGIILQAPVSDREAMVHELPAEIYEQGNNLAREWIADGRAEDCLPLALTSGIFGSCPVSARRWLSLASPDGKGEDDYFSSDLPDERLGETFGRARLPVLVLMGERDEYVPPQVDRKKMVDRWVGVVRGSGGVVDKTSQDLLGGACHNLNGDGEEVVDELCERVLAFLSTIE